MDFRRGYDLAGIDFDQPVDTKVEPSTGLDGAALA